jgi:hypothetical protein
MIFCIRTGQQGTKTPFPAAPSGDSGLMKNCYYWINRAGISPSCMKSTHQTAAIPGVA